MVEKSCTLKWDGAAKTFVNNGIKTTNLNWLAGFSEPATVSLKFLMLKIDNRYLGGGFIYFLVSHLLGEMIQFDKHIAQTGCSTTNQIYELFVKDLLCDWSVIC